MAYGHFMHPPPLRSGSSRCLGQGTSPLVRGDWSDASPPRRLGFSLTHSESDHSENSVPEKRLTLGCGQRLQAPNTEVKVSSEVPLNTALKTTPPKA